MISNQSIYEGERGGRGRKGEGEGRERGGEGREMWMNGYRSGDVYHY